MMPLCTVQVAWSDIGKYIDLCEYVKRASLYISEFKQCLSTSLTLLHHQYGYLFKRIYKLFFFLYYFMRRNLHRCLCATRNLHTFSFAQQSSRLSACINGRKVTLPYNVGNKKSWATASHFKKLQFSESQIRLQKYKN